MNASEESPLFDYTRLRSEIDPEHRTMIESFLDLRARWSRTHNMSGPMALEQSWLSDVPDAYAVAQSVRSDLPLYDVGSGSGIPGIIVGILVPDLNVHLVEPRVKRVAFMRAAIHKLGLENISLHRERWPIKELKTECQVVSRAVVDPGIWPALAARGGSKVCVILRMLAAQRPEIGLDGFRLDAQHEYDLGPRGRRMIECWGRKHPQP